MNKLMIQVYCFKCSWPRIRIYKYSLYIWKINDIKIKFKKIRDIFDDEENENENDDIWTRYFFFFVFQNTFKNINAISFKKIIIII